MADQTVKHRRYNTSPKGRERTRKYNHSDKGLERNRRYYATDLYREKNRDRMHRAKNPLQHFKRLMGL